MIGAICGGGWRWRSLASGSVAAAAMLLAGIAGGMVWAAIPALLKTRFNASEILASLMLTYVAEQLLIYLVLGPWKDPEGYTSRSRGCSAGRDAADPGRGHAAACRACCSPCSRCRWPGHAVGRSHPRLRDPHRGRGPRRRALRRLQPRRRGLDVPAASGGLAGLAGMFEVAGPDRPAHPGHLARLRLHRHHRRVPRPAASRSASCSPRLLMALLYLGGDGRR